MGYGKGGISEIKRMHDGICRNNLLCWFIRASMRQKARHQKKAGKNRNF